MRPPPSEAVATVRATTPLARFFWRSFAILCLLLGIVGLLLPVMPTVPFLIVATYAAERGWPALERWLLEHPLYGPAIMDWRERGAIPRRAKWIATVMMTGSATMLAFSPVPFWMQVVVPSVMAAVAFWMWSRPDS